MSAAIEQIKSKLSIVDVVGSYLKLDKAGGNLKAKCPFHNEKSPSFFVSPTRESYHCFGCNKGGDIFEFVKEIEGIEFIDALKILAERAGVKLENQDIRVKSEKGRLISAIANAVTYYQKELATFVPGIEYLKKRGLTDKIIEEFKIGYAPDGWRGLYEYLNRSGFTDTEIEKTGLTIKSPKGYYDRFRNRIMFPINNVSGVTVGFSGRILQVSGTQGSDMAKYINSPQTDLFDKSKTLFGFDRGRVMMRSNDTCILVEGQMDLIMSHQAGLLNTVASSGTALTEEHLKNIKRLANKLILAFDGDEAGFKASHRGIDMALESGMDVRVAKLPEGVDPADLILSDSTKWVEAVEKAKHVIDFYLEVLEGRNYDSRKFKIEVQNLVLPYVARIKSSIEQAHFVNLIARKLSIDEAPVWEELKKINFRAKDESNLYSSGFETNGTIPVSRADQFLKKILSIILWQKSASLPDIKVAEREEQMKKLVGEEKYNLLNELFKDKIDTLIFEAEIAYAGSKDVFENLDNMILDLREELLREKLSIEMLRLKKAEGAGYMDEVDSCLKICQNISRDLADVKLLKDKEK